MKARIYVSNNYMDTRKELNTRVKLRLGTDFAMRMANEDLRLISQNIVDMAKVVAPVDTGELKEKYGYRIDKNIARYNWRIGINFYNNAKHSIFQEGGYKPHRVRGINLNPGTIKYTDSQLYKGAGALITVSKYTPALSIAITGFNYLFFRAAKKTMEK